MNTAILILAARQSTLDNNSEDYPLCLAEMGGVSLIERIIGNTRFIARSKYFFALLEQEVERFHLDRVVSLLAPGAGIICVPESTRGSACTALLVASQIKQDDSLLIISANELVDCDLSVVLNDFQARDLDAGTLIFHSIHPRYSYVRLNEFELVTEVAQQNPITSHATAGIFWFKKAFDFVESAKASIRKDANTSGNYYVATTFNEMLLKQKKIGIFKIENDKYHPLKNNRQKEYFESGVRL